MDNSSVFEAMGLEVISMDCGVYHLRKRLSATEHVDQVGLLLTEAPVAAQSSVKLFLFDVPAGTPVTRIVDHWKNLDARRMEESGLLPLHVRRDDKYLGAPREAVEYPRPDGVRMRHAVKMQSGDVVCFN